MTRIQIRTSDNNPSPFIKQLVDIECCPRCGINNPHISLRYSPSKPATAHGTGEQSWWAFYSCESCAKPINVKAVQLQKGSPIWDLFVDPKPWTPFASLPCEAKRYMKQARNTLSSPDASLLMSASCVDAMLKHLGLEKGSLYKRIEEAVQEGLITNEMSRWGHLVRLEANSVRHADKGKEPTIEDAEQSFLFSEKLAEILFHIPSLLPEEKNGGTK